MIYDAKGDEVKPPKKKLDWAGVVFVVIILATLSWCGLVYSIEADLSNKRAASAAVTSKTIKWVTTAVPMDSPLRLPSALEYKALTDAVAAWRSCGFKVEEPELKIADGTRWCGYPGDGGDTIACTDADHYRIVFIVLYDGKVDLETIMMHEIGHLLGVPHIQGDPLMNAVYNGNAIKKPTPFSVAVAREAAAGHENLFNKAKKVVPMEIPECIKVNHKWSDVFKASEPEWSNDYLLQKCDNCGYVREVVTAYKREKAE